MRLQYMQYMQLHDRCKYNLKKLISFLNDLRLFRSIRFIISNLESLKKIDCFAVSSILLD